METIDLSQKQVDFEEYEYFYWISKKGWIYSIVRESTTSWVENLL